MRYLWVSFSLLFGLITFLNAAKEQKVGYVDVKYVIENYRTAQDAKSAFEAEVNRFNRIADSLKTVYDNARRELEEQKLMLSDAAIRAKELEINQYKKRYDDYLVEVWGKGGKYEQKNRELMSPIVQRIKTVVTQIANKENFTMIFDASETKIVYADVTLDITDKVLNELNKEYTATMVTSTTAKIEKDLNVAIFPFFNKNQTAQEEHIGEAIRSSLFDLLRSVPKVRMVTSNDINNALLSRNIPLSSQVSDADAFSIGLMLQADYVILGSAAKTGNRINFTVRVLDPLKTQIAYQGDGNVARIEELKQELGKLIQQALRMMRPTEKTPDKKGEIK